MTNLRHDTNGMTGRAQVWRTCLGSAVCERVALARHEIEGERAARIDTRHDVLHSGLDWVVRLPSTGKHADMLDGMAI